MATDGTPTPILTSDWKQAFRRRLRRWYAKHERNLPWRTSRDPYRVWVSEVMLQQTQVETVRAYFSRFMAAFPTVCDLAAADEQQVLQLWEGLGYYRRARGLHAAAQIIASELGGRFPDTVQELRKLPGIGRYTAGAIVSIAYDRPAPILEANTIRLFARLIALGEDPTKSAGQKVLWQVAEELLPRKEISQFNQALMELGSLVCTPRAPDCAACPVATLCEADQQGIVDQLLPTTKKTVYTKLHEAAVVVSKRGKVLVRQCGPDERWAGLWDFPRFEIESEGPLFSEQEIENKLAQLTGIRVRLGPLLQTIQHGVTRYRITLDCYQAEHRAGRLKSTNGSPAKWVTPAQLAELPLSTTGRKMATLVRGASD